VAENEVGLRLTLKERQQVARGLRDTSKDLGDVADSADDVSEAGGRAADSLEKASSHRFARGFRAIGKGAMGLASFVGRGLVTAAKAGAVGLTITAVAAAGLSSKAISLSSDAAETASAFQTVFGPAADDVGDRLDRLTKRFGLYNPELQDAARQFGVFAKAAGIPKKGLASFSTSLTQAGLDLSSFYNADPSQVFEALQSGLSGESEPLRQFGIFLSDAAIQSEALKKGLDPKALTDQQKVMLRQTYILKNLGDAQGDLARTSAGYANQQRAATGRAKEFTKLLGGPLKTAATGVIQGFNAIAKVGIKELQKALPGLNGSAEETSKRFRRWGRQLARELPDAIQTAKAKWGELTSAFANLRDGGVSVDLGKIGASLGQVGTAVSGVDWAEVRSTFSDSVADSISVFSVVIGFAGDHVDELASALPFLAAGFVAYKSAQAAANIAALIAVPLKVAEIAATHAHTKALKEHTVATVANGGASGILTAATGAQTVATTGATGAQTGLNAALRANPIGAVITVATLLIGGFILLYKHSETFRGAVNGLWNNVLKPFGKFLGGVLLGYVKLLAKGWLSMARFGVMAFRLLLTAAFRAFDGILSAAEKGLGWVPGLGDKIKGARAAFDRFGDATIAKLKGVEQALSDASGKVDALGRKHATPTVTVSVRTRTDGTGPANKFAGDLPARAGGGPVKAGQTYLVGEQGMELFRPKVDGTIVPNHALPKASAPNLRAAAAMPSIGMNEIADQLDSDASSLSVGPAWPGGPLVVQLVVDGRVLAEATLDDLDSRAARR
jgi:hypothetical protein